MLSRSARRHFSRLVVFGGGTRGGGIAHLSAAHGMDVTVVEATRSLSEHCERAVHECLRRTAEQMAETNVVGHEDYVERVNSKLNFTSEGIEADRVTEQADLIIEAIVEDMASKRKLWSRLDGLAPPECVFASNTTSLSVRSQAEATNRPQQFLGLHFFPPIVLMKLVEVVKTEQTSENVLNQILEYVKDIGKEAVLCRDTKGFIVNRLLVPLILEAARMVERGDATKEDVDRAMRLGAGHPLGPFALCDNIGVDVISNINKAWHQESPGESLFKVVSLIQDTASEGKWGKKSGEGFYKYVKK
mmetsp:Transcript_8331/g.11193  ORF Transcript_8331/g.11193 Transcript_8331/m.11193 type:complete len:303 (-) Transcript_8331:177-1085(-)